MTFSFFFLSCFRFFFLSFSFLFFSFLFFSFLSFLCPLFVLFSILLQSLARAALCRLFLSFSCIHEVEEALGPHGLLLSSPADVRAESFKLFRFVVCLFVCLFGGRERGRKEGRRNEGRGREGGLVSAEVTKSPDVRYPSPSPSLSSLSSHPPLSFCHHHCLQYDQLRNGHERLRVLSLFATDRKILCFQPPNFPWCTSWWWWWW